MFKCVGDGANKSVLNMLKSHKKVKVQRIAVVKFGMYNRYGDSVGWFEVKVWTKVG